MSRATYKRFYSRLVTPEIGAALGAVAKCRGVSVAGLTAKSRHAHLVDARFIAYGVLREMGLSLPDIGAVMNRDHSTVMNGLAQLEPRGLLVTVQAVVSHLREVANAAA